MTRRAAPAVGAIIALLALACAGPSPSRAPVSNPSASGEAVPQVSVTLGIHSGRADPTWTLSGDQAADLLARIGALPSATGTPPEGGLGYHGFELMLRRVGQVDQTLVAYRGAVAESGPAPRAYRRDPARTIERLLLDTGRSHLAAAEIATVEADLAAR